MRDRLVARLLSKQENSGTEARIYTDVSSVVPEYWDLGKQYK
jgi:hypothetical protein